MSGDLNTGLLYCTTYSTIYVVMVTIVLVVSHGRETTKAPLIKLCPSERLAAFCFTITEGDCHRLHGRSHCSCLLHGLVVANTFPLECEHLAARRTRS
jgi:hypothetical protein